jgi:hypothetical protein
MKINLLHMMQTLLSVVFMLAFSAMLPAQNVGIGTNTPAVRLDIAGTGAFNLAASEGDLRLGDATNRLKMGIGNTGSNAGQAYIAASRRLFLGTSNSAARTQSLVVDSTGYVGIGVVFPSAPLDIVSAKSPVPVLLVRTAYNGTQNISAIRSAALVGEGYGIGVESIGGMAGGYFTSNGGSNPNESYGVYGKATGFGGLRAGVYGEATDGPSNWGGYFPTKTYVNELRVGGLSGAADAAATITGKLVADSISIIENLTTKNLILTNNLGLGTNSPAEKLEINGNLIFSAGADRVISVTPAPSPGVSGNNLTVKAGDGLFNAEEAATGGNLELSGGKSNYYNGQLGGNIILSTGLNQLTGGIAGETAKHGDIIFNGGNRNFSPDKVEYARMDGTNGNWGFGTSTPAYKVDINGNVRAVGNQDVTASFQNTAGKTALAVKGKTIADGEVTLAQNTGNIGVGSTPLDDIKLYALSNQQYTAYFHNSGGNNALVADGNVVLTNFLDNIRGNVGVGVIPANNIKLLVKSSLDNAAWVENTNTTKLALDIKGKMKLDGTSGTALNIVKGGDIRIEDDNGTSSVLVYAQVPVTPGENKAVLSVLSDSKLYSFNGPGVSVSSDARLKQDITPIDNSLQKLMQLNGYSYRFKTKATDPQKELGVLAQEVKAVLPEAVYTDAKGMYSVSYNSLVPLLINAVKEQQQEIAGWKSKLLGQQEKLNTQQQEITALKALLANQQEIAKRLASLEAAAGK